MTYFLGVDPGITGGWAILTEDESCIESGDFSNFTEIKEAYSNNPFKYAFVEKVYSTHGMNPKSQTTLLTNFGGWLGALEILGISTELVMPQKWQKCILGNVPKGETKKYSLKFAQKKWPELNLKNMKSGVPDALCIALYGKRQIKTALF